MLLDELVPKYEPSFYGERDYEDVKPEPGRLVNFLPDREGLMWRRFGDGWCVQGDERVQLWPAIHFWFEEGSYSVD